MSQNCMAAIKSTLSLDFDSANTLLNIEREKNPNNLIISYVAHYQNFLTTLIEDKKNSYQPFIVSTQKLIEKFTASTQKEPYKNYCLTDLYFMKAYVNVLSGNFFMAALNVKEANDLTIANVKLYPQFVPNKKSLAILNIGFGSIPKNFSWVLSVFNISGSYSKGMRYAKESLQASTTKDELSFLATESILIYSFSKANTSNNKEDDDLLNEIFDLEKKNKLIDRNQLFFYSGATYLQDFKSNDFIISFLHSNKPKTRIKKLYYLDYMKGLKYLYKNDQRAASCFADFLNNYKGQNFRKAAYQKLAWYHVLNSNPEKYSFYMSKVISYGAAMFDSDKEALKEAKQNKLPNKFLLKARLLFDGGYYDEAIEELDNGRKLSAYKNSGENLEYHYRLGRVFDMKKDYINAEKFYLITIEKGKVKTYYFAANSALNLGQIYEEQKKYQKAREMYQLCLDLEFDEYQNSITRKAKAGLNRLNSITTN